MKRMLRGATAFTVAGLLGPAFAADLRPMVATQPDPSADVAPYFVADTDPRWTDADWSKQDIEALRGKVKYVFVIFNENRSFDHEYGTFPGVNGLYSDGKNPRSPADTPGFTQTYVDTNTGETVTVQPFRVGPEQNSTFKDSTDHSHPGLAAKIDVENGVAQMDKFALVEWRRYARLGGVAGEAMGKQFARLVMAHIDCDTIPFFWRYASRFTIFDNIFATEDTPSTPNAIAMIAGQSGETQWVKHPSTSSKPTDDGFTGTISGTINGKTYSGTATTQGPPLVNDPQPWWGSEFDDTAAGREPTSSNKLEDWRPSNIASNLTFASLPLTFMGGWINWFADQDRNPAFDLLDVQKDIAFIGQLGGEPVQWRWYQNGYDREPTDLSGAATHENYVSHHNGPQYFGYIANNPAEETNLRGEGDFFADMAKNALPRTGGVFYIRGGYYNLKYPKQTAIIQNPNYPNRRPDRSRDRGDQRRQVRRRRSSELFRQPAQRGDGGPRDQRHRHQPGHLGAQRDHHHLRRVRRPLRSRAAADPELRSRRAAAVARHPHPAHPHFALRARPRGLARRGRPQRRHRDDQRAVRPARALQSSRRSGRARRRQFGQFNAFAPAGFEQKYLGPRDTNSPITDSLLSGFDKARVSGALPLLPASYAMIPSEVVETFPHYGGKGCEAIGVKPEDVRQGVPNVIPDGFNNLPSTLPAYN